MEKKYIVRLNDAERDEFPGPTDTMRGLLQGSGCGSWILRHDT